MSVIKPLPASFFGNNRFIAYAKSLDPACYYPIDDPIGATIVKNRAPSTRGSRNGTVNGSMTFELDGLLGKAGNFDGVNDTISVSSPGINIREFSVFWLAKTLTQDDQWGEQWNDWWSFVGAAGGLYLAEIKGRYVADTGAIFTTPLTGFTGAGGLTTSVDVRNTGYHSFTLTASATNNEGILYKDGVEIAQSTWAPSSEAISTFMMGGRVTDTGRAIRAEMQHFIVAGRPFTLGEVEELNKLAGLL